MPEKQPLNKNQIPDKNGDRKKRLILVLFFVLFAIGAGGFLYTMLSDNTGKQLTDVLVVTNVGETGEQGNPLLADSIFSDNTLSTSGENGSVNGNNDNPEQTAKENPGNVLIGSKNTRTPSSGKAGKRGNNPAPTSSDEGKPAHDISGNEHIDSTQEKTNDVLSPTIFKNAPPSLEEGTGKAEKTPPVGEGAPPKPKTGYSTMVTYNLKVPLVLDQDIKTSQTFDKGNTIPLKVAKNVLSGEGKIIIPKNTSVSAVIKTAKGKKLTIEVKKIALENNQSIKIYRSKYDLKPDRTGNYFAKKGTSFMAYTNEQKLIHYE